VDVPSFIYLSVSLLSFVRSNLSEQANWYISQEVQNRNQERQSSIYSKPFCFTEHNRPNTSATTIDAASCKPRINWMCYMWSVSCFVDQQRQWSTSVITCPQFQMPVTSSRPFGKEMRYRRRASFIGFEFAVFLKLGKACVKSAFDAVRDVNPARRPCCENLARAAHWFMRGHWEYVISAHCIIACEQIDFCAFSSGCR
jgi:hypothetical protein